MALTPKLLGIFGLRYDVQRYGDRPGRVVDVERAFGIETGIAPIDDNNISPRVSFTYDVRGDATELIRAGAGLFYGRVPFVMGSNVAITDNPLLVVDCRGSLTAIRSADIPPSTGALRELVAERRRQPVHLRRRGRTRRRARVHVLEQRLRASRDVQGQPRLRAPAAAGDGRVDRLLYTESSKLYTVRNINLRDAQFELATEGGRRVFVPAGRFAPARRRARTGS